METEPSAPQFASMQFNPFSQNFQQQQEHHHLMIMQQQQLLHQQQQLQNNQQHQNQDEEMEADDATCDMKYNENDMNQMNVTMNNVPNNNCKNNEENLNHIQNAQMNQQFHHIQQQLKFGRLVNENEYFKKNKQLIEDEESYEEDDYDEEEEEDDLEDYDEDLVREMMISATPDIQNIIKLIISGFSACASETLRFLMEEENLSVHSPIMVGLIDHLKTQETMLIVNCLRTQQIIKQQILANQLSGKGPFIDPKMNLTSLFLQASQLQQQHSDYKLQQKINANNVSNQQLNLLMMNQLQANQNLNRIAPDHQNLINYHNQVNLHQNPVLNHPHVINNNVINNNINTLEPIPKNNSVPLTSSPINNKPFDQVNGKKLDQNSSFPNNLHNAFGGNKAHSNISSQNSSAQNSPSRSPSITPPPYSNFKLINQHQNQSIMNPNNPFSSTLTNFAPNNRVNFFNQTNILPQYKHLNDSGFSE